MVIGQGPLVQHGGHDPVGPVDAAPIGFQLPGHEFEQGGFAGAIAADQADPVTGIDGKRKPGQDLPALERFADFVCPKDAHGCWIPPLPGGLAGRTPAILSRAGGTC